MDPGIDRCRQLDLVLDLDPAQQFLVFEKIRPGFPDVFDRSVPRREILVFEGILLVLFNDSQGLIQPACEGGEMDRRPFDEARDDLFELLCQLDSLFKKDLLDVCIVVRKKHSPLVDVVRCFEGDLILALELLQLCGLG